VGLNGVPGLHEPVVPGEYSEVAIDYLKGDEVGDRLVVDADVIRVQPCRLGQIREIRGRQPVYRADALGDKYLAR
jgi:hypothetical protein